MSADGETGLDQDPSAAIEAWRAQGDAQVDPVGFAIIEALARRAAAQHGEARRLTILRIQERLLARQHAAKRHASQSAALPDEPGARGVVLARLSQLVDRLGRLPASSVPLSASRRAPSRQNDAAMAAPVGHTAPLASRNAVTAFKSTWSRLRAERRLSQALAQVPAMAGPLNSSHVMNRTLQAMRDLSPEYLDAFMLHIDTLLWLEQASGVTDISPRASTPSEGGRGPGARAGRKG
jgi:hypothetical protein